MFNKRAVVLIPNGKRCLVKERVFKTEQMNSVKGITKHAMTRYYFVNDS
jgi:hypothetical protein